jgi:hypothetical protein
MAEQSVQVQGDADFIVKGIVSKFRKNYTFTVAVYDAENGKLMLSSDPVESENVEELLSGFRKTAPVFYKKLEDKLSDFRKVSKAPAVQQQPTVATQPTPVASPTNYATDAAKADGDEDHKYEGGGGTIVILSTVLVVIISVLLWIAI